MKNLYKKRLINFIKNNNLEEFRDVILNIIFNKINPQNSNWLVKNILNNNILLNDIYGGVNSNFYRKLKIILTYENDLINFKDKDRIYNETEFLYNENGYLVVSPLTERASCFWGLNTKWRASTTNHDYNTFDSLFHFSPLYICITPNGEKYHFHSCIKPVDSKNNELKSVTDPILRKLALLTNHNQCIDINYSDISDAKILCYSEPESIRKINKNISNYEECCKIAVQKDGRTIRYIDKNLPYYEELCKLACKQNGGTIQYIDKKLPYYEECCKLAVQQDGESIQHIDKDLPYYEECCKLSVQQDGWAIRFINKYLPYYEKCCKLAVQENGELIQYMDKSLSYYEELCKLAVQQNGNIIQHIDKDLPCYEKCCKLAVKQHGNSIYYINKELPYYKKCCKLAVQQDNRVIQYINKNLPYYPYLLKISKKYHNTYCSNTIKESNIKCILYLKIFYIVKGLL